MFTGVGVGVAKVKQPWQRECQTGSLLMGVKRRGVSEEKRSPCCRWLWQQERLLLALIGSLHGGEVHGESVVYTHSLLSSPLLFPLLSFSEESCDGSLIRINGHLSLFLVFLPVFYIKKIPQIILTVEGNWRYHVVNCRADQYNNLIWTHSHFSNEKWNKHLFFLIPSFAPAPPRSNLPFFLKASQGVQLTAGSSD